MNRKNDSEIFSSLLYIIVGVILAADGVLGLAASLTNNK